jgi:peroxiredoxin Q/BCP
MKVIEGDQFPDFSILDEDGKRFSLENLKGRTTVLYFYPKDETSGCTKEACSFRDSLKRFEGLGVAVYGASVDSPESHRAFKAHYNINFMLLSDQNRMLVDKLGIKTLFGTASRVTFVLDKNTKILKIYPHVAPDYHPLEIIKFLEIQKPINIPKATQ